MLMLRGKTVQIPPFYSMNNKTVLLKLNVQLKTKVFMIINVSMISPWSVLFSYIIIYSLLML